MSALSLFSMETIGSTAKEGANPPASWSDKWPHKGSQELYSESISPTKRRAIRFNLGVTLKFLQAFLDATTVFACFMASYFFYVEVLRGWSPQTLTQFATLALGASILYVIILDRHGIYRRERSLLNIIELRGIAYTGIYAAAIILSLSFYIRAITLSRIMLTAALTFTPLILYIARQIFYSFHLRFHRQGWTENRVLIYGAGNIGTQLAKRIFESPSLGLLPVGFLDDDESKYGMNLIWKTGPKTGVKILGGEDVIASARALGVSQVFIALPSATFERNQALVDLCIRNGMDYVIVPNAYEKFIQRIEMFEIGGIPLLRRRSRPVSWLYLLAKRVVDFAVATICIVLLSPLVLVLGLLIKLDSKGPVIFKQKRVGLRGKEFSFYKFRSMHVDAAKYAVTPKDAADPRITKVGKWLRRTSLDELPQLFNVLRGDMSMVGPRPEMPFIVNTYSSLERQRLEARPGITGVWQISAVRGEPIHANLEYDLFYLENRSLLLDFAILVKTLLSVIRGIGAV